MIALVLAALVAQAVSPAPSPSSVPDLPEIGHVRATSPACAVMHDLVIPSFAASVRADRRFAETRKQLPRYIDLVDDPDNATSMYRQSLIERFASDAATLQNEAEVLSKALGDPRLAGPQDAQVQIERAQLEQLYEAEQQRAAELTEFVQRERVKTHGDGMEDSGAFVGRLTMMPPGTHLDSKPPPPTHGKPGMPLLSGNPLGDKETIGGWSTAMAAAVRDSENRAAKTFLPIAQNCR